MTRLTLIVSLFIVVLMAFGCSDEPITTEEDQILLAPGGNSEKFPFTQLAFGPCADGGDGELVEITGTMHSVSFLKFDETGGLHGGLHAKFHFQPQGATGIGLTTGDVYQAVGVTQETNNWSFDDVPHEWTYINNFRMIGQGKAPNFNLHVTWHLTMNANGEVTADFIKEEVTCK